MTTTLLHHANGRVYVRKFDHDEARARYAAGESVVQLAAAYGVNYHAVRIAVDPAALKRDREAAARHRTGVCEVCGGYATRLAARKWSSPDGRQLCAGCRSKERRESLRFDGDGVLIAVRCALLDCANGERWQPPENFPGGVAFRDVRAKGIHSLCRACNTRTKRLYREARKQPCKVCGKPRYAIGDTGATYRGYEDSGLCRPCWHESRKAVA